MFSKTFLGFLLFLFAGLFLYLFLNNNIHTVIPREIYRSGQLRPGALAYLLQAQRIKSVINLRGERSTEDWYIAESAVTKTLNITQYDLTWHAYEVTPASELQYLVQVLAVAPRPILIHCQGGSDRTGLASAIVLILDENATVSVAAKQFSPLYFVIHDNSTAKLTLPYYATWLEENHLASSRENFMTWVTQLKPGVNYPA